jgi:hypothetical protein
MEWCFPYFRHGCFWAVVRGPCEGLAVGEGEGKIGLSHSSASKSGRREADGQTDYYSPELYFFSSSHQI